ncbi:hypothetical protein H1R20_g8515, partial [Candolleomyces eurysporus]
MVDFVTQNAGNALLYVQCDAALRPPVVRQAKKILCNASRLKSVVINLQSMTRHDGRTLIGMLSRGAVGSADNLEYLKIAGGHHFADRFEHPLAGGVPSLRYLELAQFWVPWTSHLLQATRLTHLLMRPAPPPTSEFYDFLRRVPHLKTLRLQFTHEGVETSPYDTESRIQLHSLESLELSGTPHILCGLLGRVGISPNNLSRLVLDVFIPDHVETAGIDQFLLAWRHAIGNQHRDPISPECIRLSTTESIKGEWTYGFAIQAWDSRYQNVSSSTLLGLRYRAKTGLGYSPWANIKVRSPDGRFLPYGGFPFPNTVALERLWPLANLRILILSIDLPWSYWPELALSLVLEAIHIPAANVGGFVEFLLESWYPPPAPAGSEGVVQIPFPALRLFIVGAMTDHQNSLDRTQTARRVVDALEKRVLFCGDSAHAEYPPKLDSLEFHSCRGEIDSETLSRMSALATNVLWDSF